MGAGLIWVVVNCDGASDKLRENIDHGNFAEANALKYQLDSLLEKIKATVTARGGTLHIAMPDRAVLEVPLSLAEEIPNIIQGYAGFFGSTVGTGMGMSFKEASSAALKSTHSGNIELFDPADESFRIYKNDDDAEGSDLLEIPPNLFDPLVPKKDEKKNQKKYISSLSAEQQMQQEATYLQAMVEQMGGGQPPMPPQQDPNQQQDQQPRDLLEALHGKQIEGREDPNAEQESGNQAEASGEEPNKPEGSSDDSDEIPDRDNDKLASLLGTVKQQIPQIMSLAESNPDAFKQTMNLLHKLIAMGKSKKNSSKTEKSELFTLTEELNKRLTYPIGTIKGRKKKVAVGGKAKWRSMASGQVKDTQGQAISVRANNAGTKDGEDGVKG